MKTLGFSNPRSPTIKSNAKRIALRDLSDVVRGMLDDSGYIFSDEYEVRDGGGEGREGGRGREGGKGREGGMK